VANGNGKKKKPYGKEQTARRIIEALKESRGLLTDAAKRAGVSYSTVWQYAHNYPSVKQAVEEAKEGMLDLAESKLFHAINNGNMTAIIFFLKTKGKERGYVERSEHTGENGLPIQVEVNARDKLLSILNRLASRSGEAEGNKESEPEGS